MKLITSDKAKISSEHRVSDNLEYYSEVVSQMLLSRARASDFNDSVLHDTLDPGLESR